ncbi:MAG: electron transport complex subunit RsxC [Actinobacteria bacterium]|nr:electron transport complex subunit RsxC [Actinomycetota bacterium]
MIPVIRKKSAFRGLHLRENKFTASKPIEILPFPSKATVALQQSLGAPCKFIVERGNIVKTGQKIADSGNYVSAPIHSPVSGKIARITKLVNPSTSALMDAVIIESDGEDHWIEMEKKFDICNSGDYKKLKGIIDSLTDEVILALIRESGIVGLGGATFPTHVKLKPPPGKKIDIVILNGCECEPFITSDHRIMLEYGKQVLAGLYIISRILSPGEIYIAIEDNKRDAIEYISSLMEQMGFTDKYKVVSLPSRYPMGAEKSLIKTIVNRTVPMGGLPLDVGTVVNNVATAKAVYEAVIEGKPLVEKVVTVTGGFENPKNFLVRIGTPIIELIGLCGLREAKECRVIMGGPMMGNILVDTDFPVIKATNCILIMDGRESIEKNCINCGRCIRACPMNLMPLEYVRNVKKGNYGACRDYYIENCIECGSCAYVCPANIPIVGYIKTGKSMLPKK